MKKLICTTIIIFSLCNTFAQSWAPVGAKWYYSHGSGAPPELTIIESVGDTIINTNSCRILKTYMIEERMDSTWHGYWDTLFCPLQFTYLDSGIVYIFDQSNNDFDILYNFNSMIEDTITVKDSPFPGYCPEPVPSNLFKYFVDSVTDTILNGVLLQKQYISPTQNSDWVFINPYLPYSNFPIIENIGSTNFLFGIYSGITEGSIIGLRCYHDSILSYKASFWPDTVPCGHLRPLHNSGLGSIFNLNRIEIYPNPANSKLFIDFKDINDGEYTIEIYSVVGKLQVRQAATGMNSPIDIKKLSKGLYLVRVRDSKQTFISKFVKE